MIYTIPWAPSVAFLGVLMLFLIIPVLAMGLVVAAALAILAILAALAVAIAASPLLALRAARRSGHVGERTSAPQQRRQRRPAATNTRLQRAR